MPRNITARKTGCTCNRLARTRLYRATRYVNRADNNQNVSRCPYHPIWDYVQDHLEYHMFIICNHCGRRSLKTSVQGQKIQMRTANAFGNLARVYVPLDMEPEHMAEQMVHIFASNLKTFKLTISIRFGGRGKKCFRLITQKFCQLSYE